MMTMTHIIEPITVRHEMAGYACAGCNAGIWQGTKAFLWVALTFSGRGSWGAASGPWFLYCLTCHLGVSDAKS